MVGRKGLSMAYKLCLLENPGRSLQHMHECISGIMEDPIIRMLLFTVLENTGRNEMRTAKFPEYHVLLETGR